MDQRMVGNEMRRRMGAPSSHLGMVEEVNHMGGNDVGKVRGVPSSYPTGSGSTGPGTSGASALSSDNTEFASSVSSSQENEPHPARPQMSPAEAAGARLTVSPSMKIPTVSPAPTQGAGQIVPSGRGRTTGTFFMGADEAHQA